MTSAEVKKKEDRLLQQASVGTLNRLVWMFLGYGFTILFIICSVMMYLTSADKAAAWWIIVLFAIPLSQPLALWLLHKNGEKEELYRFCSRYMCLCMTMYIALWFIFLVCTHVSSSSFIIDLFNIASYAGLGALLLLLWPVLKMSYAITTPNLGEGQLLQLRNGAGESPFPALQFFFMHFLVITYVIGFLLAFHDKAQGQKKPALQASNTTSEEFKTTVKGDEDPALQIRRNQMEQTLLHTYKFYFEVGKDAAEFQSDPIEKLGFSNGTPEQKMAWRRNANSKFISMMAGWLNKELAKNKRVQIDLQGGTYDDGLSKAGAYLSESDFIDARNKSIKDKILESISVNPEKQQKILWWPRPSPSLQPSDPILAKQQDLKKKEMERSIGLGRLSRKKSTARTRRELQSLRAEMQQIAESLKAEEKERETILAEIKNETSTRKRALEEYRRQGQPVDEEELQRNDILIGKASIYQEEKSYTNDDSQKRTVIATVKVIDNPVKPGNDPALNLLDYMYFTIYTITTTGYGDIVPKTAYAKFLTSLANVLEVFFFVVFFNALLSVRKQQPGSQS